LEQNDMKYFDWKHHTIRGCAHYPVSFYETKEFII